MLVSALAVPATATAAFAKPAASPEMASADHAGHHRAGHHGGTEADQRQLTQADLPKPCEQPCPDCPSHGSDPAGCMLKCFQHSAAPLPVANLVMPDFIDRHEAETTASVARATINPLFRPPIA